ncbi:MAG: c-type cytochrome [Acidimicrobiales bacterium]
MAAFTLALVAVFVAAVTVGPGAAPATAQDEPTTTQADDSGTTTGEGTADDGTAEDGATEDGATEGGATEDGAPDPALLQSGQEVYSQICSSCHQPGGAGLPGQFPPLIDNPNVLDAAYVTEVVSNGKQGELTVNGETYNGVMPSFSTLGDEDIAAVSAYVASGFAAPAAEADAAPTGPVAGTELPAAASLTSILAYLLAAAVAALVLYPRLVASNDRLSMPWLDAALKTAVIVLAVALLIMFVPNWVLKTGPVEGLSRFGQDLVGTAVWGAGILVILGGLWMAEKRSQV